MDAAYKAKLSGEVRTSILVWPVVLRRLKEEAVGEGLSGAAAHLAEQRLAGGWGRPKAVNSALHGVLDNIKKGKRRPFDLVTAAPTVVALLNNMTKQILLVRGSLRDHQMATLFVPL